MWVPASTKAAVKEDILAKQAGDGSMSDKLKMILSEIRVMKK